MNKLTIATSNYNLRLIGMAIRLQVTNCYYNLEILKPASCAFVLETWGVGIIWLWIKKVYFLCVLLMWKLHRNLTIVCC